MRTKCITIGNLKKGDIILSTTPHKESDLIRQATGSKYSHARLYVGAHKVVEAINPQVLKEDILKVLETDKYAAVFRYINLSHQQEKLLVDYANKQRGKDYDLSGAIGSSGVGTAMAGILPKLQNYLNPETDFYCSELVAFAYRSAGIQLTSLPSQTKPEDLARSKVLKYVGHLKLSNSCQVPISRDQT